MKSALCLFTLCVLAGFEVGNATDFGEEGPRRNLAVIPPAVEALASYPNDIMLTILKTATTPEALVRLRWLHHNTAAEFRKRLALYPVTAQKELRRLAQFPELIRILVTDGRAKTDKADEFITKYPEDIQILARRYRARSLRMLADIDTLLLSADRIWNEYCAQYPEHIASALTRLVDMPEITHILIEHIEFSALSGAAYSGDSAALVKRLADRALDFRADDAQALIDWGALLEKYPNAAHEIDSVAREYKAAFGNDTVAIKQWTADSGAELNPTFLPFWLERPDIAVWGIRSGGTMQLQTGWSVDRDGRITLTRLPSYHFTAWFLDDPAHYHRFPHFTEAILRQYETHPDHINGFTDAVNAWLDVYNDRFPRHMLRDDPFRAERLADYGRLEKEYLAYDISTLQPKLSRKQYLQRHRTEYPNLIGARPIIQRAPTTAEAIATPRMQGAERGVAANSEGSASGPVIRIAAGQKPSDLHSGFDRHVSAWNIWRRQGD